MTDLITVVALDDGTVDFVRLLRTLSLHVTELLAVGTLDNATIDRLAGILKALSIFRCGWPAVLLLRAGRLVGPAPGDGVLLVEVALQVH